MRRIPLPFSLVLLATLAGCPSHNDVATTAPQPPMAQAGGQQAPLYDVELIYADYEANRQAAEGKYRGTTFFVTGRMQRVSADAGGTTLDLKAEDPTRPVHARLRPRQSCGAQASTDCSASESVAALLRGAKVYMECTAGDTLNGFPELIDCTLVPAGDKIDVK